MRGGVELGREMRRGAMAGRGSWCASIWVGAEGGPALPPVEMDSAAQGAVAPDPPCDRGWPPGFSTFPPGGVRCLTQPDPGWPQEMRTG